MSSLPLHIRLDDLSDLRIAQFLEEHLQDMRATSPPESVHALDLSKLRDPSIHFGPPGYLQRAVPSMGRWSALARSNAWMRSTQS